MLLRLEEEKDYQTVENLTREAFWNVYRPGCVEHLVLHKLRQDSCFVPELDYVLEEDGQVIAHIAYAQGTLTKVNGEQSPLLLFGPVSVLPSYQKKGYGDRLIRFTLEKAAAMGYPAVVITGSPDYYSKFGFEQAALYGIVHAGLATEEEAPFFMVKVLDAQAKKDLAGVYQDPACYLVTDEEAEAFDSAFPPKVKEVRPGQLV